MQWCRARASAFLSWRRLAGPFRALPLLLPWPLLAQAAPTPDLKVSGARGDALANLEAFLNVTGEDCELPAWRERGLLRRSEERADEALRALGHYGNQVSATLQRQTACWTLQVQVQPGPRMHFDAPDVRISGPGADLPPFRQLLDPLPIRAGDPLRHDHYESLKKSLQQRALDHGFFEHRLTAQRLEVDPDQGTAHAVLHLDTGPRYHFGDVDLEQDVLHSSLAQKLLRVTPGAPYESRALLSTQQRLNGSGYYTNVRLLSRPDSDDRTVPVRILADPRPRYAYMAGIGFSTDVGPRLRLGFEDRRLNRAGHRYSIEGEASEVLKGAGFNYEIPIEPMKEKINLSASVQDELTDNTDSELYRLGVAHQLERDDGWVVTSSLEFEREYFEVADLHGRTDLLMPGLELARTRSDHPLYPQHGWRLSGKLRVAREAALSSLDMEQFVGQAKLIFPLLGGRILTRASIGFTRADEVIELPSSIRFFAGGDNSVRGYAYKSLGPTDARGRVIGGRYMFTGSVEYDRLFRPSWAWALFVDAGNAFDDFNDVDIPLGLGAGIRWRSPIGPIRFDLAHPTDERRSVRFHISMGTDL